MGMRKKVNPYRDRKIFAKTANRTRKSNVQPGAMRGGLVR